MTEYISLVKELAGLFEKPLDELPANLRRRVEREFLPSWDFLTPTTRQEMAEQADYREDPSREPERSYEWDLGLLIETKKKQLQDLQNAIAKTAAEISQKESMITEAQGELATLQEMEKHQADVKSIGHLKFLRSSAPSLNYVTAIKKLLLVLESTPKSKEQLVDFYQDLYAIKSAIDKVISHLGDNANSKEREFYRVVSISIDNVLNDMSSKAGILLIIEQALGGSVQLASYISPDKAINTNSTIQPETHQPKFKPTNSEVSVYMCRCGNDFFKERKRLPTLGELKKFMVLQSDEFSSAEDHDLGMKICGKVISEASLAKRYNKYLK